MNAAKPRAGRADSTASVPDLVGQSFDDFRILRLLGQGGMGSVYLAEQISLKRKVAIKVLRHDVAANATALARFQVESKTIAQLSHANVVQAYTVGEHQGRHYLVLEYVEGVSLRDYMARKGPLDVPLVFSIMRQVASALHCASELGIVHRDIKPENILLTRKGQAKVADFGLSRCLTLDQPLDLTRAGTAVGTPRYMSPEQIEGKAVDYRSDIYSFGVTCYHMLAGKVPFDGSNAYDIAVKIARDQPAPLETIRSGIPAALVAIVRKMMAKPRHARYPSAHDLLQDLARVRESLGNTTANLSAVTIIAETPPDSTSSATVPVWRRPGWRLGGLALAVVAVLIVAMALVWPRSDTTPGPAALRPDSPKDADAQQQRDEALKKQEREKSLKRVVDQYLSKNSPNPSGVEDCIDLGVLYLDQNKVGEAVALFKRMSERPSPSAYHFVGRLGLAVTDAVNNEDRAAQAKFSELFRPKTKDNRVRLLNDYLKKKPKFEEWVNEADLHDVRSGVSKSSVPQGRRRPSFKLPQFRKS